MIDKGDAHQIAGRLYFLCLLYIGGTRQSIAGDVDLFGWSTASTTYGISTSKSYSDYSGDFVDWGKAYCEKNSIAEGTWYTLTKDEWKYLISKDGPYNIRTGKFKRLVTVCGNANCLILAPDDFEGTIAASYDAAAWANAEAAGLVCLPAAGKREGSSVDADNGGRYWSSSAFGESSAYNVLSKSSIQPASSNSRYFGVSVRLVTEVK